MNYGSVQEEIDEKQSQVAKVNGKYIAQIFVFGILLISLVVCVGLFYHANHWKRVPQISFSSSQSLKSNHNFKSQLQIENQKNEFALSGFCYKVDTRVRNFDIAIVLQEAGSKGYIIIPTHMVIRNDLSKNENRTNKIGNFAMYDASGFETKIRKADLGRRKKYKVYILYRSNSENILFDTGESIYNE
jgi:hypothetical protein